VRIVVGGHHATVAPRDFNMPSIDLVVIGEGVHCLREIVRSLETGGNLDKIPGLGLVRAAGEMLQTAPRPYPALDSLPLPDRSLNRRYRHHYFSEWLKPLVSVRTSMGCTSRCNFCALWPITDGKYLRRTVASVIDELKTIEESNVFFCDDESMCDVKRMSELAHAIAEADLHKNYFLYARADTVVAHPELFVQWRKIGLAQVFIGMESFSDARLARLHKEINVEQHHKAAAILHEMGVIAYANFMVDTDFDQEDFTRLRTHVRQLGLKHVGFSVLTPLPGTELYLSLIHI